MSRIQWNEEEIAKLAPPAATEFATGEYLLYEAVDRAQRQVLPMERWRSLATNQVITQNKALFDAIQKLGGTDIEPKRRTKLAPEVTELPKYDNKHVRWSNEECEKLALHASNAVREGTDILSAVLLAQEQCLPPGRRRSIRAPSLIPKPLTKQIQTLASLPPRAPALGWTAQPLEQIAEAPPAEPVSIEAQLEALGQRFKSMEFTAMQNNELLEKIVSLLDRKPENGAPAPTVRKSRIILCGLLPEQLNIVSAQWSEFFDLRGLTGDRAKHISLDAVKNADFVLFNKRHNSHAAQARIRAVIDKEKMILVDDPVTGMCKALESIFAQRFQKNVEVQH